MIMFWHRKKLLAIEEQLANYSTQLNETLARNFDEISKEQSSLRQCLEKIEGDILQTQETQEKILDLLVSLADNQRVAQVKLFETVEGQRDPMIRLLDIVCAQGDSVKALSESVTEVKTSLDHNQQECVTLNEKVLNALRGAEHSVSEKVVDLGVSVIQSQKNNIEGLSDAIAEMKSAQKLEQQNSDQRGIRLLEVLQGTERALSDKVVDQTASIKDDMDILKKEILDQGGTIREIDAETRQIGSDIGTLDEAMRLLLVNTLLNNLPE